MFRMAGAFFVPRRGSNNHQLKDIPMTTNPKSPGALTLTLEKDELSELLPLLEHALGETRVEVHHTHTPDFRAQVKHRETILKALIEKLKNAGS
jgi:hypothetical protein